MTLFIRDGVPPVPQQNLGFQPLLITTGQGEGPVLMERYRPTASTGFLFTRAQSGTSSADRFTSGQLATGTAGGQTIDISVTGTRFRLRSADGSIIGTFFITSGAVATPTFEWVTATYADANGAQQPITSIAAAADAFPGLPNNANTSQDTEPLANQRPSVEVEVIIPAVGSPLTYTPFADDATVLLNASGEIASVGYTGIDGSRTTVTSNVRFGSFGIDGTFLPQDLS